MSNNRSDCTDNLFIVFIFWDLKGEKYESTAIKQGAVNIEPAIIFSLNIKNPPTNNKKDIDTKLCSCFC